MPLNASECNQCLFRFYKYLHASFVHGLFEIKPSNSLNGKCVHLCILKPKITKSKPNQSKMQKWEKNSKEREKKEAKERGKKEAPAHSYERPTLFHQ